MHIEWIHNCPWMQCTMGMQQLLCSSIYVLQFLLVPINNPRYLTSDTAQVLIAFIRMPEFNLDFKICFYLAFHVLMLYVIEL